MNIKIAVIGLGYVGLPLARLFATKYPVVGFDINQNRIQELNAGIDSTLEIDESTLKGVLATSNTNSNGLFCSNIIDSIQDCNYYIVTVPTPVDKNNRPDLTPLYKSSETVGKVLKKGDIVIYESTVYPGVTEEVNVDDLDALKSTGAMVREWVVKAPFPVALEQQIRDAYAELTRNDPDASFAVRSSATAEDLPDASFAGQQETFLNIKGIDNVLEAIKEVFASLYNDRAISYRVHKHFDHADVALSAGVQRMVRSDTGAAGVMFTMDTESGFRDVVFITSSYGLGEMVVQGAVNPDEFYVSKLCVKNSKPAVLRRGLGTKAQKMVFGSDRSAGKSVETQAVAPAERERFSLTDADVEELARYAMAIEAHYGRPMDIEWGKEGASGGGSGGDGKLYILQARPETVKSQETRTDTLTRYRMSGGGQKIAEGRAIGSKVGQGVARVIRDVHEIGRFQDGDVIVTDMTDPNWEPVMKRASAIVTNRGGRTCHAAIIARELGVPAVVGCEDATDVVEEGETLTVSCCEGDTGNIYRGKVPFDIQTIALDNMPEIPVKIAMNVGNPELAFDFAQLPNDGVGLARLEFIISNTIGIHPKACIEYDRLPADLREQVAKRSRGYANPVEFYKKKMVEGVATIAAAFPF